MSRSHSVERESKPLPPVPQAEPEPEPPTDSLGGSLTDQFAQTLKKMSEELPTTEYRSPLNLGGRLQHGISELTKEVIVPYAGRSTHHHDRHDNHRREREDSYQAETIRPTQYGEGDSITSAERIRKGWQERQDSSHHRSQSEELSRSKAASSQPPPTAFRSGEGFPWFAGGPAQPGGQGSFRGHRRERSADTPPQGSEFYENSDESGQSSIRLEIHNASPLHTSDSMKSRGRPSLTTRLRSSFQKARVGAARPARERTDLSRSPSPNSRRRSPSPRAWRKPSPHSSIRATDQYSTPRTGGGVGESLPRIESQKMDLGWEGPANNGMQSPPRPPIETIPTIPDLHTPGPRHEEPRTVPIIEPDKPRMIEIHEQPPSHRFEASQSTDATAVNPPTQREHRRYRDDSDNPLVVRNYDGQYHTQGGQNEGPRRFKRLLSLTTKPVPIEGDDGPSGQTSPSPSRPKMVPTPSALIRSTSLIRTRSRKKESSKHRERVEPETHVGYESDPWGEGPEIHRDAQGNRIFPPEPKRKTSQKKKSHAHTGPTKIALPMGQVEEFHSVHSTSPTEPQLLDPVSSDLKSRGEHKRTISTTTFHTAQSGNTRPGSPTRKLSSQSTLQVKPSAPDPKYDGWRRSRAGAPRRPSETLLASPPSNGNQYADEAPILHDQPLFTTDPQEYNQEPEHEDISSLPYHPPAPHPAPVPISMPVPVTSVPRSLSPIPASTETATRSLSPAPAPPRSLSPAPPAPEMTHPAADHRSQSPLPSETSVHIHIVHGPRMPSPVPPRTAASPAPPSVVSASPALAGGPPPLIRTSPPRRNTPPPLISTPPPRIVTPPPAMSMPVPITAPAPVTPLRVIPQRPERPLPAEPPRYNTPPVPVRTPSPPAHASPDQTPPIQTPRAHTPNLEDIQINPADTAPGEPYGYEDPRYRTPMDPHPYGEPEVRSPIPDTPTYVLPRQPTPTLTTPGVMLNPPSGATSPTIDRDLGPRSDSPPRSVRIEHQERPPVSSMLSNRPMPRHLAGLSESEQQMRQQNRQTGSEMSFVNVEPLSKREKLAASVLSISSMPWLRNRISSRSHHPDSSYHDGDSRYYYDRYRQPMEYPTSATPPQLPPVDTGNSPTTQPRPDTSKELPMWYPREQTARNPVRQPSPHRESRGPRVNQEAWGWRSSPHGIPEEGEETVSDTKPPWQHGPGAMTPSPDTPRGDGMLAPPILPPRQVAPHEPESEVRPSGEKKRVPKYRIEQDERGHPVLVPEPGYDDSRWTVFEIGGVEFKRGQGDAARGTQWMPKRLSGLRRSEARPHDYQYSESPAPVHAPLEGRQYNA